MLGIYTLGGGIGELCAILRQTTDIQDNISIFSTEYIENKISPV